MSTQFAVDLVFQSKGVRGISDATSKTKDLDRAARKAQRGLNDASNGVRKFDRSARSARSGVQSLIGTLGKLAIAYGAVRAGQAALQAGIQRVESERRIKFLAREYGEVAQLSAAAGLAAKKFGLSQTEANKALATTYARLRPVGVSLKDINSVYAGFNTAAKLSGANAQEAAGAFRQLAQGLGSGVLRGDEFNSVAEQVPLILTAVSKETGIAQGKLRDYAAEGLITADVVIRALKRIEREGADKLTEAMGGPEQAIKDFQNATEDVQVALTKDVIPEMAAAFRELAQLIEDLEPSIRFIGGLISNMVRDTRLALGFLNGDGIAINSLRSGKMPLESRTSNEEFKKFFGEDRFEELKKQAREMANATGDSFKEALKKRLIAALNVIDGAEKIRLEQADRKKLQGGGTGTSPAAARGANPSSSADGDPLIGQTVGSNTSSISAPSGFFDEANEFNDLLERQEQSRERIEQQLRRAYQLGKKTNETQRELLQLDYEFLDLKKDISNTVASSDQAELFALAEKLKKQKELNILKKRNAGIMSSFESVFAEGVRIDQRLIEDANKIDDLWADVGKTIKRAVVDTIQDAIKGTADLSDVLSRLASQLGGLLINSAFNGFGAALNLPGFAKGGVLPSNGPAIVGENGPEFAFSSGGQTTIVPFDAFGASRDALASGSDATAFTADEAEAYAASSNYITNNSYSTNQAFRESQAALVSSSSSSERITERQMLERQFSNPAPIKLDIETTTINNVEYLTVEQGMAMAAASVQQAKGQVFSDLKNRPAARRQVGMR